MRLAVLLMVPDGRVRALPSHVLPWVVQLYTTPSTASPYNLGFTAGNVAEGRRGLWARGSNWNVHTHVPCSDEEANEKG